MKKRATAIAIAAFLGIVDTLYLSAKHGKIVPCFVTQGCETVLNSAWSTMGGIPLPWIGLVFYVTVFSLAVFEAFDSASTLKWIFWLALPAFGFSLNLIRIQAFVLEAFCAYCLGSAALVTTIFVLSMFPRSTAFQETSQ